MKSLVDRHGRQITYLRLSVTDLCNLRCTYCMPEEGIDLSEKEDILSFEELEKLVRIFVKLGIKKLRLTGGEPFVRAGLTKFIKKLKGIEGLEGIYITTNGILLKEHLSELKSIGISGINLSLDTLEREKFKEITRRDKFEEVIDSFQSILDHSIPLKINSVVQSINFNEIVSLASLTKEFPVDVRFIEEMPFNGGDAFKAPALDYLKIIHSLEAAFPDLKQETELNSTAILFKAPEHKGKIGVIAASSRLFCGSCNRVRVSAKGGLKTCLFGDDVLDIKEMMRNEKSEDEIIKAIQDCVNQKYLDGFKASEARENSILNPMVGIGG